MNNHIFRGSNEIIEYQELEQKLKREEPLRIKHGIDPTGDRIHIGHASTLRKLKHFQDMGHQVVLIVGSFTAQIGDSSDKSSERQTLSKEEVEANMRDYQKQLGRVIDIEKAEVRFNHEWFQSMELSEWLELNQLFSVAQMIERENFAQRFQAGKRIGLQEFQYPIMQAYDSVAVKADVEIGGTDQLFNMLGGRQVQKHYGQSLQDVITYELLCADDGSKMSKSWENCIWVDDAPSDMYGKVMRIDDDMLTHYFTLATDVEEGEIEDIQQRLEGGENPRDIKQRLAREIVSIYHGETAARQAEDVFVRQFQNKELPESIPETPLSTHQWELVDLLVATELAGSKSQARRLVGQGGIRINGEQVQKDRVTVADGDVLQAGKRHFRKIRL
jgi:tyrosyl-tRNA synthetase